MNKSILAFVITACICCNGIFAQNADAVAEKVRKGTVHASDFGFDKTNATKALRAALESDAKTIIVDNMGADWIVEPIAIPSNVEVVFKDGVVIRALKGSFESPKDSLFDIREQRNVFLKGEGKVTFVMNKKDYQDATRYKPGEWRHTVCIMNCDGVSVENFTMLSSGGDGVYVGSKDCKNVRLVNLDCQDHHRQGISITGVKNLYVKNCKFNGTKGAAPQCGIDFEPNFSGGVGVQNIVMENCEFNENAAAGICISNGTILPTTITIRDSVISGNKNGGLLVSQSAGGGDPDIPGKILFERCRFENHFYSGVAIGKHFVPNLKFVFNDCVIDNRKSKRPAMFITSNSEQDVHGIEIRNLTVIDDNPDGVPVAFQPQYCNALIDPVVENVVTKDSKGNTRVFDCAAFIKASAPNPVAKSFKLLAPDRSRLKPLAKNGVMKGEKIRYRGKGEYFLYAKAGQKIPVTFTNVPVYKHNKKPVSIVMSTPTVPNTKRLKVTMEKPLEFVLEASETGVYRFEFDAHTQTLQVACDAPGQAISSSQALYIFGCRGQLFFRVPAGVKEFMVEAAGTNLEESDAYLLDPAGKTVDSGVKLAGGKLLKAVRENPDKAEVWSVKFRAVKLNLRLGAPLTMLFAGSPDNLLYYPEK